jgi:hypothetical protein
MIYIYIISDNMESNYDDLKKKFKNEFDNYLIFTSIKLLNLFGFKYCLPKVPKNPKNHLVKYIEYQTYLQKEKEKEKEIKINLNLNYHKVRNKYYMNNINVNIVDNNMKKYLKI